MTRQTPRFAKTSNRRPAPRARGGLAAIALLAIIALAVWSVWTWRDSPLTARAAAYAQDVATASAAVYVTLRTLNSFLSTAEEVEVGASLVGSASVNPLKFLEPVDDTVERIANAVFNLMLVAGVLAVALGPAGGLGWVMVALAAVLWLGGWIRARAAGHEPGDGHRHGALGRHLMWYGVFLAIALPGAFLLSDLAADRLTASAWAENQAVIDDIIGDVTSSDPEADDKGIRETIDDYRTLAVTIYDRAGELLGGYVALLSIFIFKLFVLPLMLAGGFLVAARTLARGG